MSFSVPTVPPRASDYAPQTIIGQRLCDAMGPWLTRDLAMYLDACGACFEQVAQLVIQNSRDGQPDYVPGYGKLLDPTLATGSELQYLGQFVGVTVGDGTDDTTARSMVLAEAGLKRGTRAAVVAAAQRWLSGTQSVRVLERRRPDGTPDAYWFLMIVRSGELVSQSDLIDAVNATKPGGLQWKLIVSDGYTWAEAIHLWSADTMTWAESAYTQP